MIQRQTKSCKPIRYKLLLFRIRPIKKLTALNDATKFNLRNYLSYYRILTDAINIKNGYIVNIGVDFEIVVKPNYNGNDVLLKCIQKS